MTTNWKFAGAPLLLFAALLLSPLAAAASEPAHGKIVSMTRTAVIFSALEKALDTAVHDKDEAGLAKLLTDDFELRDAAMPANPVPRADWLARSRPGAPMQVGDIAVHDFGDTAVVSFVMINAMAAKPGVESTMFVVDVWHRLNGEWRLAVRYQPGKATEAVEQDKKPNGKG